jgi:ribonuclease P/MRP protein subunit RPP1
MQDIVFPKGNEQEMLSMAKKLGYSCLVCVYQTETDAAKARGMPEQGLKTTTAILAMPDKALHLRRKGLVVFVKSSEKDRQVLEQGSADVLFGVESVQQKDYAHQRGSGLNHVLCSLAHKNHVAIGFGISDALKVQGSQRARLIGRMMQNIALCRKYRTRMVACSFASEPLQMRTPHDIRAFLETLGMHPKEAQQALQNS